MLKRRILGLLTIALCGIQVRAQIPGLVPIDDLGPGSYLGFTGGLYPRGVNEPPLGHLDRAMLAAASIEPLDATGSSDPDGAIVLVAIGMSNTNQEFAVFERQEDAGSDRNARVVLVDGAVGGQDAVVLANPASQYWNLVGNRLLTLDLTPEQVQVAWLKEEVQGPVPAFPLDAMNLRGYLQSIVQILHDRFPNLKLCYLSSRIYGGYGGAGEPKAYESGFAVKWLIEDQIAGDPALNDGRLPGPIEAPLLLWGPYLWANGPTPRSDGLTWLPGDLETDNTHPSAAGEQKVASLLSSFFDSDPTAAAWWPRRSDAALVAIDADKDAHVSASDPAGNFGGATQILVQGGAQPMNGYIGLALPALGSAILRAKLSLRVPTSTTGGGFVSSVSNSSWSETDINWINAPSLGPVLATVPQSSRDGTIAADVTSTVNGDVDGVVSFGLSTPAMGLGGYHSREAGQPPRVVLTVSCAAGGPPSMPDGDGDGVRDACDCAPSDSTTLVVPLEITGLLWLDANLLHWDSAETRSGSSAVYDVMSGALDDVDSFWPSTADLCVATGVPIILATDATSEPAPGSGRYYLVRGRNACGAGRWETASDGRDRLTAACAQP